MRKYYIPNNKYYITDDGHVFNKETDEEFIPCTNGAGYKMLYVNGKLTRLHRLIAEIWIPNPENKPEVDHINRIRDDNRVENLRWVTKTEQLYNRSNTLPEGSRAKDLTYKEYKHQQYLRNYKNPEYHEQYLQNLKEKRRSENYYAEKKYYHENIKNNPEKYERMKQRNLQYCRLKRAKQHGFDTWEEYQESKAKNS